MQRDPRETPSVRMERYRTNEMQSPNRTFRSFLEKNVFVQSLIKFLGVMGICMVIAGEFLVKDVLKISALTCFRWCLNPCSVCFGCYPR